MLSARGGRRRRRGRGKRRMIEMMPGGEVGLEMREQVEDLALLSTWSSRRPYTTEEAHTRERRAFCRGPSLGRSSSSSGGREGGREGLADSRNISEF